MVRTFAQAVMGADADAVCGAGYGERTQERVNSRNGYRDRPWDTRVGSIELRVPKLRTGSYVRDWLLGRRTRAEQALISVVATAYLLGVSTRRVEGLVNTLGIEKLPDLRPSVAHTPSCDASVTPPCGICGRPTPSGRARRWCSPACRQTAYRRRTPTTVSGVLPSLPPARSRRDRTIYACPACDTRLLGEQRCPDCNTFATRIGPGGTCPHCDQPVAITDLQQPPLD